MNEMNEKISFKSGERFAASFYMGKNFPDVWHVKVPEVNYNQFEVKLNW